MVNTEKKGSPADRIMADLCRACPVCRHARNRQKGLAYSFVKTVENNLCPLCRAYERVYGRKAHEPARKD